MPTIEPLKYEGVLENVEPMLAKNTGNEFWLVKLDGVDEVFSTFSKTQMEKLEGNEGKKFSVTYRKSADGKWNNIVNVELMDMEPEPDVSELITKALGDLDSIRKEVSKVSVQLDSILNTIDKVGKDINTAVGAAKQV
jgi:hypothetical protein